MDDVSRVKTQRVVIMLGMMTSKPLEHHGDDDVGFDEYVQVLLSSLS